MQKQITRTQYLAALDIMAIARKHYEWLTECQEQLAIQIDIHDDGIGSGSSYIGDEIWGGNFNLDNLLKQLEIEVLQPLDLKWTGEDVEDEDHDPVLLYDPVTGPITDSQLRQICEDVVRQGEGDRSQSAPGGIE